MRFDALLDMFTRVFQRNYFVAQDGALKPALWAGEKTGNAWLLRQPGARQWWEANRYTYGEEFVSFVEGLIDEE